MSDSATLWTVAARLLYTWDFPGKNTGVKKKKKNTGVDCHSLFQGTFLTQESNLGLLHCGQILYPLYLGGQYDTIS